ncbi:hypothetical protein PoB_002569600 [Plakobranchus ocellatus]|uniref:Uncharacterized protein n=1 Tax=Plakobranchus ocellatus TaxID=259542 RepID=A0AAV3ZXB7_9GAST|nr:hypothetical protein PoB_002569600 [Plakobranchus ocellatus]
MLCCQYHSNLTTNNSAGPGILSIIPKFVDDFAASLCLYTNDKTEQSSKDDRKKQQRSGSEGARLKEDIVAKVQGSKSAGLQGDRTKSGQDSNVAEQQGDVQQRDRTARGQLAT